MEHGLVLSPSLRSMRAWTASKRRKCSVPERIAARVPKCQDGWYESTIRNSKISVRFALLPLKDAAHLPLRSNTEALTYAESGGVGPSAVAAMALTLSAVHS